MREYHEIPIEEIKNLQSLEWFKYVRVGEEIRFTDIGGHHMNLLDDGETAISAGTVKVYPDEGFCISDYSMTLKVGPHKDDKKLISNLLGLKAIPDSFGF